MNRPFLFMAGEWKITMGVVFSSEAWNHTMRASKLILDEAGLHRNNFVESLSGIIFYADMQNKEVEIENLELIIQNKIPCWPDPNILINLTDRHTVLQSLVNAGLVAHPIVQDTYDQRPKFPMPYVMKTGLGHRGEGKFLIRSEEDIKPWEGIATLEPFFVGKSVRILFIGNDLFGLEFNNEKSWIKNSAGCCVEVWADIPERLKRHARLVKDFIGLEVIGIDYIMGADDSFQLLEVNQFPGIDCSDEIALIATNFLKEKLKFVEGLYNARNI